MLNFFPSPKSQLAKPGARSLLFPELPKVPKPLARKAANTGTANQSTGQGPDLALPQKNQQCDLAFHHPADLGLNLKHRPAVGRIVIGNPVCSETMLLTFHPPRIGIGHAIPVIAPRSPFAERQIISSRPNEVVSGIKESKPTIRAAIISVHPVGTGGVDATASVISQIVGERLAQGVGAKNSNPL